MPEAPSQTDQGHENRPDGARGPAPDLLALVRCDGPIFQPCLALKALKINDDPARASVDTSGRVTHQVEQRTLSSSGSLA